MTSEPIPRAAVEAVGRVAPDSPSAAKAVAAIAELMKTSAENEEIQESAAGALRSFGPQSWQALTDGAEGVVDSPTGRQEHVVRRHCVAGPARAV